MPRPCGNFGTDGVTELGTTVIGAHWTSLGIWDGDVDGELTSVHRERLKTLEVVSLGTFGTRSGDGPRVARKKMKGTSILSR